MKDHEIEDCTPDCFDEKEALIVPAKQKFTDEDLRRLKEVLNGRESPLCIPANRFRDLLSRMEAAESVCEASRNHGGPDAFPDQCNLCRAYEAWRKCQGKK